MEKLKIIIADDHPFFRKGVSNCINDEYPDAIITEASDSEEAMKMIFEEDFTLLICDISMPGRSGMDLLKHVVLNTPNLPVLMLSFHHEEEYAIRAFKAGAKGFLNKECSVVELIDAVNTILSGKKYIPVKVAEIFAENLFPEQKSLPHELLSDRELEVFKLIVDGKNNKKISTILSLSQTTISTYRFRILDKMKMNSNVLLVKYALEYGLQ